MFVMQINELALTIVYMSSRFF